jgi:hypothetical protein
MERRLDKLDRNEVENSNLEKKAKESLILLTRDGCMICLALEAI